MSELQEFLCLKDRDSFTIDPKGDCELYFGRRALEEKIRDRIQNDLLLRGVPKLIMHGPYGSGKTHTLYHIRYFLQHLPEVRDRLFIAMLSMGPMKAKTPYKHLHAKLLSAIGRESILRLAESTLRQHVGPDMDASLRESFETSEMANAIRFLCLGGKPGLAAWKWLNGDSLSASQQEMLNIVHNLDKADEQVRSLLSIGRAFVEVEDRRILFLIDEGEALGGVSDSDAIEGFRWALKELADDGNAAVGFVLAYQAAAEAEDIPLWLTSASIMTRLGGRESGLIEIPFLAHAEDTRQFIRDLLDSLVDKDQARVAIAERDLDVDEDSFPFSEDALRLLEQYVTEDPLRALPRIIISKMNECAVKALREGRPLIDAEIVGKTVYS